MAVMFICNIIWMIVFTVLISIRLRDEVTNQICREPFFLTERMGAFIVAIFFMLMGTTLNKVIYQSPRVTEYEKKIFKSQKKSLRRLWLLILTFVTVAVIIFIIDLGALINHKGGDCDAFTDVIFKLNVQNVYINNFIYCIHRLLQTSVWNIPILYVFWITQPKKISSREINRKIEYQQSILSKRQSDALLPVKLLC